MNWEILPASHQEECFTASSLFVPQTIAVCQVKSAGSFTSAKQEFGTVGLRSRYYRFTDYILSFSQACVSPGKGLSSETSQEKKK